MIQLDTVPIHDWVTLTVGAAGAITVYLSQKDRLPSWARKWLNRIGSERITDAIERAGAIAELSPDERRSRLWSTCRSCACRNWDSPFPRA